jgi:hypothetical protein
MRSKPNHCYINNNSLQCTPFLGHFWAIYAGRTAAQAAMHDDCLLLGDLPYSVRVISDLLPVRTSSHMSSGGAGHQSARQWMLTRRPVAT